jgi:hypothetical protein
MDTKVKILTYCADVVHVIEDGFGKLHEHDVVLVAVRERFLWGAVNRLDDQQNFLLHLDLVHVSTKREAVTTGCPAKEEWESSDKVLDGLPKKKGFV